MGNVETATKFSGLKSISSIEDNYTEVNTKVFYIKAVLKNFAIFTGEQLCWSLCLIKLQAFKLAALFIRDSSTGALLCILRIFICFEKHLRNAASDSSFSLVIYLFLLSIYNYEERLILYGEEKVH